MDGNRKVIYDLYIDIPDENLCKDIGKYAGDKLEKSERSKIEYNKYYDELLKNKEDYAKKIGADFFHHGRDEQYSEFFKEIKNKHPHLTEYLIINFYKLYLLEIYADKYDEVLYVDFDVVFNTDEDFFEVWNMKDGIHVWAEDYTKYAKEFMNRTPSEKLNLRSMVNKYFISHAMLMEEFEELTYPVINTGIIGSSSDHIKKLAFMKHLDDMIRLINWLKEDPNSMYSENIQSTFDWNNEPMFTYRMQKENIPLIYTNGPWNVMINSNWDKRDYDLLDKKIIHMIYKRFDWCLGG